MGDGAASSSVYDLGKWLMIFLGDGKISGLFSLVVAVVGITFLFVSQKMLNQYQEMAGRPFARGDSRWRFYSIFAAIMLLTATLALGYAFFAGQGVVTAFIRGDGWAWFFVVMSWLPMPSLLLELTISAHVERVGFTRLYEGNMEKLPKGHWLRRANEWLLAQDEPKTRKAAGTEVPHPEDVAGESQKQDGSDRTALQRPVRKILPSGLAFLSRWVLIYAVTPAMGVHLRLNRALKAEVGNQRYATQIREDWIVMVSTALLLGLIVIVISAGLLSLFKPLSWFGADDAEYAAIAFVVILTAIYMVSIYAGLKVIGERDAIEARKEQASDQQADWTGVATLFLLLLAAWADVATTLWLRDASLDNGNGPWVAALNAGRKWVGGVVPIVLFWFMLRSISRFLNDIARGREAELELVQQGMVANLLAINLHHFGNKFVGVEGLTSEVRERAKSPPSDPEAQARVWQGLARLADVADASLAEANAILEKLKGNLRHRAGERDESFSIAEAIQEAVPPGRHQTRRGRRVSVVHNFPVGKAVDLRADRQVFINALTNLGRNAMDAIDEAPVGGRDDITVTVTVNEDGPHPASLTIRDNGVGMTNDTKERMYDSFFSTKPHGSGMGLYIVRQFVENIDARIRCQSTTLPQNRGTEFKIDFPSSRIRIHDFGN